MRARAWERRSREAASLLREATERLAEARLRVDSEAGDGLQSLPGSGSRSGGGWGIWLGLRVGLITRLSRRTMPMMTNSGQLHGNPDSGSCSRCRRRGSNPPLAAPGGSSSPVQLLRQRQPLLPDVAPAGRQRWRRGRRRGRSRWSDASYSHSRQAAPLLPQMLNGDQQAESWWPWIRQQQQQRQELQFEGSGIAADNQETLSGTDGGMRCPVCGY
uniref:Uncharacterized protein n=1 Tax=Macrostomum lignano TaxID=282301 RepID=A0A1I8FN42_9PLAT